MIRKLVVTLCQTSEKVCAEVNLEVWAVPRKCGKLDMEPLQSTLKPPGQVVSKKQYLVSKEGREVLQPLTEFLLKAGLLEPHVITLPGKSLA